MWRSVSLLSADRSIPQSFVLPLTMKDCMSSRRSRDGCGRAPMVKGMIQKLTSQTKFGKPANNARDFTCVCESLRRRYINSPRGCGIMLHRTTGGLRDHEGGSDVLLRTSVYDRVPAFFLGG